jgi:hypothetical protein
MRRSLGSTLLVLFASGCGGGLERVTFVTDRLEYAASDRVMLTATNVGNGPITLDLCAAVLEAEKARGATQETTPCDGGPVVLAPGERTSTRRVLRLATNTGGPIAMRYSATATLASGETEALFTPVFQVTP